MAKVTYTNANAVYSCCAKYLAVTKAVKTTIHCPVCGKELNVPIKIPRITIVDEK